MDQQVDFYIVRGTGPDAPLHTACRLAEKAFGVCRRVYILAGNPEEAQKLDDLLWTYRQESFIPHAVLCGPPGDELFATAPVQITSGQQSLGTCDVLINLSDALPLDVDSCARIVEIVPNSPPAVAAGRDRYRFYRDRGARLNSHEV